MLLRTCLFLPLMLCAPLAWADGGSDPAAMTSPWSGSGGELGFASAHGNSTTESFNGRLKLRYTDDDWVHSMDLFGLRSSAEYKQTDDNGNTYRERQTTANRYTAGAGSALQLGEHRQQDAAEHHNDLCLIAAHDIGEDALEHLAGVFDLGAGAIAAPAGADLYDFRLLCHYASPPFSSKSPEPLVWLL